MKCNETPCIIVLNSDEITKVRPIFLKHDFIDLDSLYTKNKHSELTNLIETTFVQRTKNSNYGVFFMTKKLGRGTDFPSSNEIEA